MRRQASHRAQNAAPVLWESVAPRRGATMSSAVEPIVPKSL
jgi:hypothetical protein